MLSNYINELTDLFYNPDINYKNERFLEIGNYLIELYDKKALYIIIDLLLEYATECNYSNDYISNVTNLEFLWNKHFTIYHE